MKHQLPTHILAVKPTQTAFTGLQLVLKSSPNEVRLMPDGVSRNFLSESIRF